MIQTVLFGPKRKKQYGLMIKKKAERFANDYFKNFNSWEIVPLRFDINKMEEVKIK